MGYIAIDLGTTNIKVCCYDTDISPLSLKRVKVKYSGTGGIVEFDADEAFTALDWLARLVTHIPNKGEQLVRYYGYYSNKSRGMRKKKDGDNKVPALVESDLSRKRFRKNWARLIQKIYNVDPLCCPKCNGPMRIISFIEDELTVKKILKHLGLWMTYNHGPPSDSVSNSKEHMQLNRSIEWWESVNDISVQEIYDESNCHMPYEDEYSQVTPYDEHIC
jgi:hypothetical protein